MSIPRASLIISTWNGRHLLEGCLPRALRAVAEAGGDHEVIVVDDASTDDTVEYVGREFPQVRLLPLKHNLRFAGANNAAARIAKGDILVFLNNDVLVEPDFLAPLLQPFSDLTVFAVTAQIQMSPKLVGGKVVRETGLVRARFEEGLFVLQHEDPTSQEPVPVIYAGGGSSAWRRDRFFRLGCFDQLFRPFYFEDLDVSFRAQKAGWGVLFQPASRVIHQHRQTNNPSNFRPGYVELMFGKNNLLFTWKVLTDPGLVNAHFRRLWCLLMHSRANPRIAASFLRAAAQLPELLPKRRRARAGAVVWDREVLEAGEQPPTIEAGEAGGVPAEAESAGTGKRVLVMGFSPLPFEPERRVNGLCFRTWHIALALLRDGHEVTLVGCRLAEAYTREGSRPDILEFRGRHFRYYSAGRARFEGRQLLQSICDQFQPDAVVTVHSYCAWVAARLRTEAPLWADLYGSAMMEAQAQAALGGDASVMAQAWEREKTALARADLFSVASASHKYALIGELAAAGRLGAGNYGEDVVHYMPNAVEPARFRHRGRAVRGKLVGESDFVILWAGGYPAWADVDTLFEGVTAAMRADPRIKFVSTGGAMPDGPATNFYRLRRKVEESEFAERFTFTGWVSTEEMPNYYYESDVGISIDRFSYETLIGGRYRILDMLRAGLPVITTLGTEISHIVRDERLGIALAPGDVEGLRDSIVTLAKDESLRRRCAERARQYVSKHRGVAEMMMPLRRWARDPALAPDRSRVAAGTPSGGWQARGAAAGLGQAWETGGVGMALRQVANTAIGGLADLLSRMFVRRRAVAPWGLDPREPPQRVLVIRAGPVALTREMVERIRERYSAAELSVLAPSELAAETKYETGATVVSSPGAGTVSYRVTRELIRRLQRSGFDTIVVAGEGNRRAELVALLAGLMRRVEIREDGAAHVFSFAPYKPLWLLTLLAAGILEKLTLTVLLGVVWGSIWVEGSLWRMTHRPAPAAGAR